MTMENDPNGDALDRLFAAARKDEPYRSGAEYGFEARVMARIRAQREGQTPFLRWSWRLIPLFVSVVFFLGIWTYVSESHPIIDLSAITRIGNEEATLVAFLTGE
jgi:hypothetical protein